MLYEILTIILAVYAMCTPFFIIRSIKFGALMAQKSGEPTKIPDFVKLPKRKTKKDKEIEKERQKIMDIMDNVDAFDGTGFGQKEIK